MTRIDLLYVSHNRLAYTTESFNALLDGTDWDIVGQLIICDDESTDGTYEWLANNIDRVPSGVPVDLARKAFGGPVAALNYALEHTGADYLAKIDNDLIVCLDWLNELYGALQRHPRFDAVGTEPGFASRVQPIGVKRGIRSARWIGGQGLFRTRCFRHRPSAHDRWFGLTQHWRKNAVTGWIDPDLPCFNLDHVSAEPWRSLAESYVEKGWSRRWAPYSDDVERDYAGWWLSSRTELAAVE